MKVPLLGALIVTGEPFEPFKLVDVSGKVIGPVAEYFSELLACGRSPKTLRSYGMDLLRWFRFVSAIGIEWDQATQVEGRDFFHWLQIADKPIRPHWRYPDGNVPSPEATAPEGNSGASSGSTPEDQRFSSVTVAHCESVLRSFYDIHIESGTGPTLNPFPLTRSRKSSRTPRS
ncbi:site-specific integrase [Glutamicibacter ardleyensis]|uniref:site-specific integrase n=1 Tax=Glutamicibacter ardleyensis TaxID=225894 RepID=UPI003FD5BDCC